MPRPSRLLFILLLCGLCLACQATFAQSVIATVSVGLDPNAVAVDAVTNKTYVEDFCGTDPQCQSPGTVTVIDGSTNNTVSVTVGREPQNIAVNSVTNKIYVANLCGDDPTCNSSGTVTVIDGATNNTLTVPVPGNPEGLAVNEVTNKIYIADGTTVTVIDGATNSTTSITMSPNSYSSNVAVNSVTNRVYSVSFSGNTVTVIDGDNNNTLIVNVGYGAYSAAVDSVANKIYVVNACGSTGDCSDGTVTVIDGASNTTATVNVGAYPHFDAVNSVTSTIYVPNPGINPCGTTVSVINGTTLSTNTITAGCGPWYAAVDSFTNKTYITNQGSNNVTVIDGVTNSTVTVSVGDRPEAEAVNSLTNRIYVANSEDSSVSVIAGETPLQLVTVAPCRLVDTRNPDGEFGGPPIQGGTYRSFIIPDNVGCGIPNAAAAYSLNVTVVPQGPLGYLTIWPAGQPQPLVSTMNSRDGRIKANAAIVPAGTGGAVSVYVSDTTNVVLDIDGYFTPPTAQTLQFYPLTPCRVLDTRTTNGDLGGPFLVGGQERDFPVWESNCIPSGVIAQAYSMNFTVVPYGGEALSYLTIWPQGTPKPLVSTLNNPTATTVANAAVIPPELGEIAVYPSQDTHLIGDINGYFAAPGPTGLSLYPTAPCRVLDTRNGNGPFSGTLIVDVAGSVCSPPAAAQAYVFNATALPMGALGYLTLWPDSESQPVVSTLNALDGMPSSNMAIVPNLNGSTDAYASGVTQLILDISSYFAP
jgi:YVTN family beta-propeller protein